MKIIDYFRRPVERKESATGRAIVMSPGQPVWSGRDYRAFADEAYRKNVIAYQSVNRIAEAVASVRWTLFRGENEITEHSILSLIRNPNPLQSGAQYMQAKVGFLMLSGNSYEEQVRLTGGRVGELYQLRPDRMQIKPAENGFPSVYTYKVGGKSVDFPVNAEASKNRIRHLRLFNPLDDFYGMSPVEAAAYGVDQHNEAMAWLQALLQNSARPSGALVTKDGAELSDENFNKLKSQIDEQYSGSRNAGRPMLLEGGLDWRQMGLSPSDMGIIEAKLASARDVALAFGVPPMLLGIPGDNTYSNYAEARLAFWEDTVLPLVGMITDDWNASLANPDGLELRPDLDQIPAISEKRQMLWEMADRATDLTINERRALKGYPPIDGGDALLVPSSSISLGMATEGFGAPMDATTAADMKALAYGLEHGKNAR